MPCVPTASETGAKTTMLLADSSAWVEHLRGADSDVAFALLDSIEQHEVSVIDPVVLEVMAGAHAGAVGRTQRVLEAQHFETLEPWRDFLSAATIYRELRRRGITIRSQMDAVIAAVAIRLDTPVLHRDRDFDVIALHTSLQIVTV